MIVPNLFLSHSGADKAAAIDLKRRLLASHDAQEAGLQVWLDIDDLDTGKPWQAQIEAAIEGASSFAVVVGSNGIHNWVRAETDIANSRAVKDANFRIIPILQGGGSDLLTPFVKRYQAVRDPLNNPEAMQRLLRAALGLDESSHLILTNEPFPGLRSMSEDWADRFFGRTKETNAVLELLRRHRAVTIVADSGAGKSSLAQAGVGHAWRGGALLQDRPGANEPVIWHVVTTRPGENPTEELRNAIQSTSKAMARDASEQKLFRDSLDTDPAFALRCGLDPNRTRILLVIDQAEELVTLTSSDRQHAFGRLIARLADTMGDRLRILVTVRSTHLGLVARTEGLGPLLSHSDAQFILKQPVDLAEIVRNPLALTNYRNEDEQEKLIDRLKKDLSDRPGDLALAQMTLSLAWRDREKSGGLLGAYAVNGGARMALGNEASRVERALKSEDAARLMPIFARLIRLSDISIEATRRIAGREEFDADQNRLIDKLAGGEFGSLVWTSATHVEIAHEALITQWPMLNAYLKEHATSLRTFSDLIRGADDWATAGKSGKHLTTLADEERFQVLSEIHREWLAPAERVFLTWSRGEHDRVRREREYMAKLVRFGIQTLAGLLLILVFVSVFAYLWVQRAQSAQGLAEAAQVEASEQRARAEELSAAGQIAERNAAQSRIDALVLLAEARARTDPVAALKLVMAAWPTEAGDPFPSSVSTLRALQIAFQRTRPQTVLNGHNSGVTSLAFSPDGRVLASGSWRGTVRIWSTETMSQIGESFDDAHGDEAVRAIAFSPGGSLIATSGEDRHLRIWNVAGERVPKLERELAEVATSLQFSQDGKLLAVGYDSGDLELFLVETLMSLYPLPTNDPPYALDPNFISTEDFSVRAIAFLPDSEGLVSHDNAENLVVWQPLPKPNGWLTLAFPVVTPSGLGFRGEAGELLALRVLQSDGKTYFEAAMSDGSLFAWWLGDETPFYSERLGDGYWTAASFNQGTGAAAVGPDGELWIYGRSSSGTHQETFSADSAWVSAVAVSNGGLVAIGAGSDGTIRIWRADDAISLDGYLRRTAGIGEEDDFVTVVETMENGELLAQFVDQLNPILLACQMLPIRDGQIDVDTTDLASEIGIPDPSLPTDCETYAPLRHPDWQ